MWIPALLGGGWVGVGGTAALSDFVILGKLILHTTGKTLSKDAREQLATSVRRCG